jgi:hypothetical protein
MRFPLSLFPLYLILFAFEPRLEFQPIGRLVHQSAANRHYAARALRHDVDVVYQFAAYV